MSLMEIRRKVSELKLDVRDLLDNKFVDESDERVLTGLIDRTLNTMQDVALEVDLLNERLELMEREQRSVGKKVKAKPKKKAKAKKKKAAKKAKAKKKKRR